MYREVYEGVWPTPTRNTYYRREFGMVVCEHQHFREPKQWGTLTGGTKDGYGEAYYGENVHCFVSDPEENQSISDLLFVASTPGYFSHQMSSYLQWLRKL